MITLMINTSNLPKSPIILVTRLVSSSLALPHPHLLPDEVGLLLPLSLVWWGVQVALVIDYLGMSKPPGKHLCAELVSVAQVCEADDVASGDRVLHHDHRRDGADLETVAEERSLFSIDLAKLGFHMFLGEEGEVFVHDLAPEGLFPVEVANHILRVQVKVPLGPMTVTFWPLTMSLTSLPKDSRETASWALMTLTILVSSGNL